MGLITMGVIKHRSMPCTDCKPDCRVMQRCNVNTGISETFCFSTCILIVWMKSICISMLMTNILFCGNFDAGYVSFFKYMVLSMPSTPISLYLRTLLSIFFSMTSIIIENRSLFDVGLHFDLLRDSSMVKMLIINEHLIFQTLYTVLILFLPFH